MVDELKVVSGSGNECKIRYSGLSGYKVADITTGKYITPSKIDDDTISFETEAGKEYMIAYNIPEELIKPDGPVNNNDNNNSDDTAVSGGNNNDIVTTDTASSEIKLKKPVIKSVKRGKKYYI